jgi:hypothetical protein
VAAEHEHGGAAGGDVGAEVDERAVDVAAVGGDLVAPGTSASSRPDSSGLSVTTGRPVAVACSSTSTRSR